MRRILRLTLVAALAALGACATETPYQARAAGSYGYGYTERAIEADRVALSFRGNSLTERDTVETYLLYRAAELTLERGFDYFVVATRDVDSKDRLQPYPTGLSFRPYYSYYAAGFGWRPWHDPFWNDPVEYRRISQFEASAEIVMRRGKKPTGDASAYDAREVQTNLGAQVKRPAPKA